MSKREVIAYAITHAPRGQKGGPYEGKIAIGTQVHSLREATRWLSGLPPLSQTLRAIQKVHPHARVIRIVRARPSEASATQQPSEASAVEVLRELVAWVDCDDSDEDAPLRPIEDAARRVLAASGPDPSEVVRAAMAELEAWEAYDAASVAKGKAGFLASPGSAAAQKRYEAAEAEWVSAAERHGTARAHRRKVTEEYRKAGGK